MQLSAAPLIYIMIFVAVLVLVEGLYLTMFGKSISLNNRVSRRLDLLQKSGNREQVLEQLRKEMSQHIKSRGIPLYSLLASKAQKANIAFSPPQLLLIMAGLSVFSFFGLTIGTEVEASVRALIAVAMGVGGVYVWVNNKASKRMALMEEASDPLGTEFGIIADEAAYGRDISESLKEFAERMDSQDLRFLAVAVTIQQTSGGNLAEILEGLSKVIRARFKLFRRVKAITAEAKWSGMFLSSFPIGALVMINILKPDYFDKVKETPEFIPAALIVAVFLVVNVIFMKMMVNIKV